MIVRTEITGNESVNLCRAVVVLPTASYKKTLEIVRTTLPRLPFRFGRAAQVMVDGLTLALPDTYSLAHLATTMSALKNSTGDAAMSCYYANNEFEVCVEDDDVTLHGELAAVLNLPEVIEAGECYSSAVDEEHLRESDYYRIVVEGADVEGHYENRVFTQTVEEYRPSDGLSGVSFKTVDNTISFTLFTQVVNKDATVVDLALGDAETACYWVKVT